jgi:O-glycosyl hydrolase
MQYQKLATMEISKRILRINLAISLLAISSTATYPQQIAISVHPETHQAIDGIGGSIAYYTNWLTAHPNKELIYDTLFTGLGLSGFRIANWAQDLDADLSNDAEILSQAQQRLGSRFSLVMSSWSAPAGLKANNSINGSKGGVKASLKKENGAFVYNQFGQWWKQSLDKYHALGIYPHYISIQNEPDYDADYEATIFNPEESSDVASYGMALQAVAAAISGMGNKPKIIGPETLGIGWNATQNYVNALDKGLLDAYCFHYYHSGITTSTDRYSAPDDFTAAMEGLASELSDKPMFMTENCSMREQAPDDAIYLAWIMANAFNINRVSAYLFWDLIWNAAEGGAIGVENPWESFSTPLGFSINPEYHALRHFSKFIQKGWLRLGISSTAADVLAAAFRSPQADAYTIVMINKGDTGREAGLALPAGAPSGGTITQTVPSSNIWSKNNGAYAASQTISLPARSITTVALQAKDLNYPAVQLQAGWNLIGYPFIGEKPVEQALASIWQHVESVKNFSNFYHKSVGTELNLLKELRYGQGYYIYANEACILEW